MAKRRIITLALMSGMAMAGLPVARAAYIWTPVVVVGADTNAETVFVDFSDDPAANPLPEQGYVIVHGDGTLTCHATGGPGNGPNGPNPNFVDDHQCNPTGD